MESNSKFIQSIMETGNANKELCITEFEKYLWNEIHHNNKDDKFENVAFNLEEEFEKKFNQYCKSYGKSDTVIGEIFRGLNKLMYRYLNDGDDICCGPYSGIWYGLKFKLDCPFSHGDNSVEYWDYDYDALSMFTYYSSGYCKNMMMNALIIDTFDVFHKDNRIDIGDYYDNIVNFLLDENTIKKFKEYDIDITNNFGSYSQSNPYASGPISINTIDEDIYIDFEYNKIKFTFNRSFADCGYGLSKFEIEFATKHIDDILKRYGKLMSFLLNSITIKQKYKTRKQFEKELDELGFMIKDRYIVKKELVAEAEGVE